MIKDWNTQDWNTYDWTTQDWNTYENPVLTDDMMKMATRLLDDLKRLIGTVGVQRR